MELKGTAAIVSGAASGLGEATAREFAAAGCRVVVADLNEERGKAVADAIGGLFVRTHVSDEESVQAAVDAAASAGPPLPAAVTSPAIRFTAPTVPPHTTPHYPPPNP